MSYIIAASKSLSMCTALLLLHYKCKNTQQLSKNACNSRGKFSLECKKQTQKHMHTCVFLLLQSTEREGFISKPLSPQGEDFFFKLHCLQCATVCSKQDNGFLGATQWVDRDKLWNWPWSCEATISRDKQRGHYWQPRHHKNSWDWFSCADLLWWEIKFAVCAQPHLSTDALLPTCKFDNLIHLMCLTNRLSRVTSAPRSLCMHAQHIHTCLQCEPATGYCCLMDQCPPARLPALPPASWGRVPDNHCIFFSAGKDGSLGVLPVARHAAPQFDGAPRASGGEQSTKNTGVITTLSEGSQFVCFFS